MNNRVARSFAGRTQAAAFDASIVAPPQIDNEDEALYPDKSGTYTKGVLQSGIGQVDLAAYQTFKKALESGDPADFEAITLGGPRTLNGPQGGLAFDLEGLDSSQFSVPPAPPLDSEDYATELVELYWASLLRDVAFTDYPGNSIAALAANELSTLPTYRGPRDGNNNVTPSLLFRGGYQNWFTGETIGPYLSQLILKQASLGAHLFDQTYMTFSKSIDFMKDPTTFQQVQNGQPTGQSLTPDQPLYLHNGRGLAAFTHADVLYQAYFTAYLVLDAIKAPLNPGNPYNGSKTQNGFNTFGDPDIAATLAAVASEALKAVWYQKWYVHLRHRPESAGALVYLIRSGQGGADGRPSDTVVHSNAVDQCYSTFQSYFLSQAFPEGSPTHPAYPTGHGTVAGACITVLKFFFDGAATIDSPCVPANDGMSLQPYTGSDAANLTINGELHKLAHNISFGHGIHAGIHWRSDTDTSIQLGEAVALAVLRDRAQTYNEKFSVQLQKVDGTLATITNESAESNIVRGPWAVPPTFASTKRTNPATASQTPASRRRTGRPAGAPVVNTFADVQNLFDTFVASNNINIGGSPHKAFWRVSNDPNVAYDMFVNGNVPGVSVPVKILVPGHPEQSNLITILRGPLVLPNGNHYPQMPPGHPMPPESIDALANWIQNGAHQ
jgi:hypothetical protein